MSDDRYHRYHRDGTSLLSSTSSSTSSSHDEDDAATNVNVVHAELSKLRTDLYVRECDATMRSLLERVQRLMEFKNVALIERDNKIS